MRFAVGRNYTIQQPKPNDNYIVLSNRNRLFELVGYKMIIDIECLISVVLDIQLSFFSKSHSVTIRVSYITTRANVVFINVRDF